MATLNKYNQMFGSYIDTEVMAGEGIPTSYADINEDDTEFDEALEERYEKYLEEKVKSGEVRSGIGGVIFEGEQFGDYATKELERERKEEAARRKDIKNGLEHETVNIYAEEGIFLPYPESTWWKYDEPDFDILENAGESLKDMKEDLGIESIVINRDKERLFEARYEFPQYEREFKHTEAVFYGKASDEEFGEEVVGSPEDVIGWIDFMGGVPYGCVEKIGIVGEVVSNVTEEGKDSPTKIGVEGNNRAVAPLPSRWEVNKKFFSKEPLANLIFNKIWLGYKNALPFTKGLDNYPKTEHDWWTRINVLDTEEDKSTITPGEIIANALWLFPNLPWGWQRTSPFMFSGNRIETVYYTSAKVLEVIDATTYLISYSNKEVEAKSSDYAIYKVGERVTILKGVEHEEDSMTWEDLKEYDTELWSIIPAIFYHKEEEEV